MLKNKIKTQTGTSLIEIMLAISIFIILGALTLNIFKSTVEAQKSAIAGQNTQENLRYLFEIMSKEIRSAVIMDATCNGASDKQIYYVTGALGDKRLYLKNKDNECVSYYVDVNDDLVIDRAGTALAVTPNDIKINKLDFIVTDNDIGTLPGYKIQPRVTIKIETEAVNAGAHSQPTVMQTTVSSRNYE